MPITCFTIFVKKDRTRAKTKICFCFPPEEEIMGKTKRKKCIKTAPKKEKWKSEKRIFEKRGRGVDTLPLKEIKS